MATAECVRTEYESEHVKDDDCTFFKYFTKFNLNFQFSISLHFPIIYNHRAYVMMDDHLHKQSITKPPFGLTTYIITLTSANFQPLSGLKRPFRMSKWILFNTFIFIEIESSK